MAVAPVVRYASSGSPSAWEDHAIVYNGCYRAEVISGDVNERKFLHWATQAFLDKANGAATVELTTSPTASWYWRGKLESRAWAKGTRLNVGDPDELLTLGTYTAEILKEYVFEETQA